MRLRPEVMEPARSINHKLTMMFLSAAFISAVVNQLTMPKEKAVEIPTLHSGYHGYADGATQFRDLSVGNGTTNTLAKFSGSNAISDGLMVEGNVGIGDAVNDSVIVNGNLVVRGTIRIER